MTKWLVMVYINADDVLANFATDTLNQLKLAVAKAVDSNIAVRATSHLHSCGIDPAVGGFEMVLVDPADLQAPGAGMNRWDRSLREWLSDLWLAGGWHVDDARLNVERDLISLESERSAFDVAHVTSAFGIRQEDVARIASGGDRHLWM